VRPVLQNFEISTLLGGFPSAVQRKVWFLGF